MPTSAQSASEILSILVASGARPGRSFPVSLGKPVTEQHTVPNDGKVPANNAGSFTWDGGVTYVGGAALTAVSGSPAQGQYSQSGGVYQFNVADALAKVQITYRFATLGQTNFPGALQRAFLQAGGYALGDLIGGLVYAVSQGWLSSISAATDDYQTFTLEQSGFAEAGGTAPTLAASAQQLVNIAAGLNHSAGGARFDLSSLTSAFVGTVGGNTFAPEDIVPGYGQALANGWVRPCGEALTDPVFALTAAGVAQAA